MLTLLSEIHFWTADENISVKSADYGTLKYHFKKDIGDPYLQSKKTYCEYRGLPWTLQNKRPFKLRERFKELEELLSQNKVVCSSWEDNRLQLLLSKGILVTITTNKKGNLTSLTFNKQLVTKLHSELICDGAITNQQVVCMTTDSRILSFGSPGKEGWTIEVSNKRNLSLYREWLIVWGKTGAEHPQPWSPLAKDHERANLHLYFLGVRGPELLAYKKTDGEPIHIAVSKTSSRSVISVEQKVTQRGAVSIEVITLELIGNVLKRVLVTLVPLQTQVSCCALSENEEHLLLGCIDGSVAVLNRNRGSTRTIKASFIPTFAVWHKSCAVMAVSNDKGQLQYFDTALNCIQSQLIGEDCIPSNLVDLSGYFSSQVTMEGAFWGPKSLLIAFERGPLVVLRHAELSLNFLSLIQGYITAGKMEKAIGLLLSWEFNQESFIALQKICNYLMKLPLTEENAQYLQNALGCYHSPAIPIGTAMRHKFGSQVQSLTRRFFHQLVRARMFETAFLLAVDLGHHDLFMDLHYIAVKIGETEMAAAARAQASALLSCCSSEASNCSRSSCSQCSDTCSSGSSPEPSTIASDSVENHDAYNDNCLSTNFNNLTPKTYNTSSFSSNALNIPPIPNVDIPKISTNPKAAYVKPPIAPPLSFNKSQVSGGLLAPPLPFAPISNNNSTAQAPSSCFNPGRTFSMPSIPQTGNAFAPFRSNFSSRPFTSRFTNNYPDAPFMFSAHSSSNLTNNTIKYSPIRPPLPPPSILPPSSILPPPLPVAPPVLLPSVVTTSVATALTCTTTTTTSKKPQAKVKFSDTVTAFIVPEVKRPVRPAPPAHMTDPQKELADSLPLCHPNEDYLKDFAPVRKSEASEVAPQSKIKVVHFGVV